MFIHKASNTQHMPAANVGFVSIDREIVRKINKERYKTYIKILYLPQGYKLTIDFTAYETQHTSLFFIAPNQVLQIEHTGEAPGYMLFYDRTFYCIQLHDSEVYCDGLLFNNIHNMPLVSIHQEELGFINYLYRRVEKEFELKSMSFEEMIRTYLKQLLIKATRLWTRQHLQEKVTEKREHLDFFRNFTRLVDANYKYKHRVADYAELMFIEPKTITHKFKRLKLPKPSELIKDRIVLEAKRLLVHSPLTIREIAYDLGYDDPAYFSRLFQLKTGQSPLAFRNIRRTSDVTTKPNHS